MTSSEFKKRIKSLYLYRMLLSVIMFCMVVGVMAITIANPLRLNEDIAATMFILFTIMSAVSFAYAIDKIHSYVNIGNKLQIYDCDQDVIKHIEHRSTLNTEKLKVYKEALGNNPTYRILEFLTYREILKHIEK